MSLSEYLLGWDQFRAMPLYLQFAVGLMILYAAAMTALSALVAPSAADQAAVLFAIAAFVWAFALYVVPSRLASKYTSES
ncbi:MAG: hypothetical protein V5A39_03990 [Haloarculaceae archaeon]